MAAETLTRRAFGHHPQFWRVWSKRRARARSIRDPRAHGRRLPARLGLLRLRRRALRGHDAGLRLVVAGRGAAASRRARDLRAVAVGDRQLVPGGLLGRVAVPRRAARGRRAHRRPLRPAPPVPRRSASSCRRSSSARAMRRIPNQPAFARPVELIIPSIGFGLLYVYFGLLPGIVLHFTFDVVWFALPIFLANAPGIWFQQRDGRHADARAAVDRPLAARAGRAAGRSSSPADLQRRLDAAAGAGRGRDGRRAAAPGISVPGARTAWLGARRRRASLVVCIAVASRGPDDTLRRDCRSPARQPPTSRARALEQRGVDARSATGASCRCRTMAADGPHEFVAETAGEARWRELLGVYLPKPRWRVRVATFEGDVADRAEEWQVFVTAAGESRSVRHTLPEGRAGRVARRGDGAPAGGRRRSRSGSAWMRHADSSGKSPPRPSKLKARTDWTFTLRRHDRRGAAARGTAASTVEIAGDEVAAAGALRVCAGRVAAPGSARRRRATSILRILIGLVFGGRCSSAPRVFGVMAWSQRRLHAAAFRRRRAG